MRKAEHPVCSLERCQCVLFHVGVDVGLDGHHFYRAAFFLVGGKTDHRKPGRHDDQAAEEEQLAAHAQAEAVLAEDGFSSLLGSPGFEPMQQGHVAP